MSLKKVITGEKKRMHFPFTACASPDKRELLRWSAFLINFFSFDWTNAWRLQAILCDADKGLSCSGVWHLFGHCPRLQIGMQNIWSKRWNQAELGETNSNLQMWKCEINFKNASRVFQMKSQRLRSPGKLFCEILTFQLRLQPLSESSQNVVVTAFYRRKICVNIDLIGD